MIRNAACLLVGAVSLSACAAATARRIEPLDTPAHPAGILQVAWRTTLHEHGLFEPPPEECAAGALARGELVLGSRAAAVVGVSPQTGHLDWITPVSGGVDGVARFDPVRGQVYVGADDGNLYAFDPASGAVRWTYAAKGAIERPVEIGSDLVYVATAANRVVALDRATGKWRWQYERDMPEGFTIHGYAGPRLRGTALLTGFADGYLVALGAATGEVLWARSLATASDQFVDVDTTPTLLGDNVFVSSYSGGLYDVDPRDGTVRWRLGIEGVGEITATSDRLFFVAPRQGLHASDLQGHVIWRQGLTEAGDLTRPLVVGRYLIFSGDRAGLFVIDRNNGGLLEIFNPGHGICAPPTLDETRQRMYVLSNTGALYALDFSS